MLSCSIVLNLLNCYNKGNWPNKAQFSRFVQFPSIMVNFGLLLASNNVVKNRADVILHDIKLTPVHAHVFMRIDLSSVGITHLEKTLLCLQCKRKRNTKLTLNYFRQLCSCTHGYSFEARLVMLKTSTYNGCRKSYLQIKSRIQKRLIFNRCVCL